MQKIIYILLPVLLFIAACDSVDENGYSALESGFKYKLHTIGDGEKEPVKGDVILAHVVLKTLGDTVLYNSKWKHSGGVSNFDYNGNKGLNQCFSFMHEGDSASFIVKHNHNSIYSLIDTAHYTSNQVKADIKLEHVFNSEQYENWLDDIAWLHDGEMNEQIVMKQYLDSLELNEENYIAGIYYENIEKGRGKRAVKGDAVFVHYKAYFLNGKEFDNTYGMDVPFVFNLGDPDQVIEGFETGLQLMKKKGKARFIIPSQLAFGEKGSATGIVPPFSTLVYEVELINIK